MSRVIQVFEFEKLTIHKDEQDRQLTQKELGKLYEFNDKNDNNYYKYYNIFITIKIENFNIKNKLIYIYIIIYNL